MSGAFPALCHLNVTNALAHRRTTNKPLFQQAFFHFTYFLFFLYSKSEPVCLQPCGVGAQCPEEEGVGEEDAGGATRWRPLLHRIQPVWRALQGQCVCVCVCVCVRERWRDIPHGGSPTSEGSLSGQVEFCHCVVYLWSPLSQLLLRRLHRAMF